MKVQINDDTATSDSMDKFYYGLRYRVVLSVKGYLFEIINNDYSKHFVAQSLRILLIYFSSPK